MSTVWIYFPAGSTGLAPMVFADLDVVRNSLATTSYKASTHERLRLIASGPGVYRVQTENNEEQHGYVQQFTIHQHATHL